VATLVVRVWLPDRPGALGAVASRVGAVKADVIGIDIIERGAGRAVDELVVDLPDEALVDLLLAEIGQVEGVDVEDVRTLDGPPEDPTVLALGVAVALHGTTGHGRHVELVRGARSLVHADWAALVARDGSGVLVADGDDVPAEGWLSAFVQGALADGAPADLQELALATLADGGPALVVSRAHLPLRGRERSVLEALVQLA
jgi:ACT domain